MPVSVSDIQWLSLALGMGFAARQVKLPPMNGFMTAGFVNWGLDFPVPEIVEEFSNFGLTLMLFCIGLKLRPGALLQPSVWAVALIHMVVSMLLLGGIVAVFAVSNFSIFADLTFTAGIILVFSLTFSSTVLAIKMLSEAGELSSPHGKLSINVLVMQDIAAVLFLGISKGQVPSPWACMLLFLFPGRRLLMWIMDQVGHGELLVLFGFVLAIGGAAVFEMVQVKGDLGSLLCGTLLSAHPKASELKHHLVHFQDLFLVGFFLSVGKAGLTFEAFGVGLLLALLLPLKGIFWQVLFMTAKMHSRTAFTTTVSLFSYSEFALIVMAYAAKLDYLPKIWISAMSVALTVSFVISSMVESNMLVIFAWGKKFFRLCERATLEQIPVDEDKTTLVVVGMASLGRSLYEALRERHGVDLTCIDFDENRIAICKKAGYKSLMPTPPSQRPGNDSATKLTPFI